MQKNKGNNDEILGILFFGGIGYFLWQYFNNKQKQNESVVSGITATILSFDYTATGSNDSVDITIQFFNPSDFNLDYTNITGKLSCNGWVFATFSSNTAGNIASNSSDNIHFICTVDQLVLNNLFQFAVANGNANHTLTSYYLNVNGTITDNNGNLIDYIISYYIIKN